MRPHEVRHELRRPQPHGSAPAAGRKRLASALASDAYESPAHEWQRGTLPRPVPAGRNPGGDGHDERLGRALGHPLRHRLLRVLTDRVASPKELAAHLAEPLPNVSYHVRVLAELGCVELVRTVPRRGALEHYYRALMAPRFDGPAADTSRTELVLDRKGCEEISYLLERTLYGALEIQHAAGRRLAGPEAEPVRTELVLTHSRNATPPGR
jgi:DNA-binding transcriptional ArsR family regulator